MASVREFYKRKLLAAKDLGKNKVTGTITAVYPETQKGKDSDGSTKLVVELDEGETRFQMNKTNAIALAKELGDETDDWIGRRLQIGTGPTSFNGKPTIGLVAKVIK